jgi:TRAP-type C4-dicarboxylate transport system permease small subunit
MMRRAHREEKRAADHLVEGLKTAIQGVASLLNRLAIGLLLLLTFLTLGDILLRKFFNKGILGALELSEFLMAAIVFFSLAQGEILQRNVSFDLALNRLPVRVRAQIHLLTRFIFGCFFGLVAAAVAVYGRSMQAVGEMSPDLLIPKYPFIYVTASGCAMLSLVLFLQFLSALFERRRP